MAAERESPRSAVCGCLECGIAHHRCGRKVGNCRTAPARQRAESLWSRGARCRFQFGTDAADQATA
jgi:hypothetical protein